MSDQNVFFNKDPAVVRMINEVLEEGKELVESKFIDLIKLNMKNTIKPDFIGTFVITNIGKKSITAKGYLKLKGAQDVRLYAVTLANKELTRAAVRRTSWDNEDDSDG